jgi:hypothetical protein
MPETTEPSWGDHPLPDPVPEAWHAVVATIRAVVDRYAGGDRHKLATWSPALTLLSLRPSGDWAFPIVPRQVVRPAVAFAAPPELVPFVQLDGDRTGYVGFDHSASGWLGWVIAAPELGRPDHPVALVDLDRPASVHGLGKDTRAGLAMYFSLLRILDMPEWRGMDSSEGSYAGWMRQVDDGIATIENALELERPRFPEPGSPGRPPSWSGRCPELDVPPGWRHEPGADNVGVLAPADAFVAERPRLPRPGQPIDLEELLADAERLLDAGAPASALLLVKEVFARGENERRRRKRSAEGQRDVERLKPLWVRAYTDLGRPQLADRVDLVTAPDRWRR